MIIRRLGPGDEDVLASLAEGDALAAHDAAAYLADPGVLHWVADEDGRAVGHLLAYLERRRHGDPVQLLLYDIEVGEHRRRQGVGRALVRAMDEWMGEHGVSEVWVLADNPGAEAFYVACGFARDPLQGVVYVKHAE
jgi:GNAT superfamily N-acetyltransferase